MGVAPAGPAVHRLFTRHSSLLTPHLLLAAIVAASMSGCGSAPISKRESRVERAPQVSKAPSPGTFRRGGGYYLDDGPGDSPPADLDSIPDAVPQLEPLKSGAMRPYAVMGQSYTPMTTLTPYKARGSASWYGRRYHGKQTSSGEIYDMYSMSAAHPVLPIPSYVRVTHLANGKSVVVRVNDRGPFIDNRLIDLSYTAAYKLGVLAGGSALVEVESIIPDGTVPGTAYALAPPSSRAGVLRQPARSAVASAKAPAAEAAQPATGAVAARKPPAAESTLQPMPEADPILVIALAARDPQPAGTPLPEPQPQLSVTLPSAQAPRPDAGGVYLQLGAFGSLENAETYLSRARVQVEWLAQSIHLFPRDGLYRVHAGPYASAGEARLAADRVGLALGAKPVIVTR